VIWIIENGIEVLGRGALQGRMRYAQIGRVAEWPISGWAIDRD
jgi:hypothetical protein